MDIENIILILYGVGIFIAFILLIVVLITRLKEKRQEDFEKRDF